MASSNQIVYNYIKSNASIPVYYINAKTKEKLYATIEQSGGNKNGLELLSNGQNTTYLISVFSSSYIKGIKNRDEIKELVMGMMENVDKIEYVLLLGEWDTDKLSNGLYSFNMEFDIKNN